jgi:hypothetical protein
MITVFEFQNRFPDEVACFEFLFEKRWPDGFQCPRCNHNEAYLLKNRMLMQCKSCKYQVSITAGTIFHKLRHSLSVLLWACFWIATTKKGISAKELQRKLGLGSYQTAWTLLHKIRKAMKSSGQYPIENDVEFDEIFLGISEKPDDDSRAIVKVVVEVGPDKKNIGRAYLEHIQNHKSKDIKIFINKTVALGHVIRTDGSTSYKFLRQDYQHQPLKMYDKRDAEVHLPKVNIVIANLKMWLRGIHNHLPHKHSQRYLDEFCFRFNRRWKLGNIFDKLIVKAVNTPTITYAELIG